MNNENAEFDKLIDEARNYFNAGDYDQAIECLEKIPDSYQKYDSVLNGLGLAYRGKNNYDLAIEYFNKIDESYEKYNRVLNSLGMAYYNRGDIYSDLKEYDKAIDDYNKAIELDPNYNLGYISRGDIYRDLKEYEKAIDDYNKAIELDSNDNWVYIRRGDVYRDLKEYEKAIDDYNKAIELKPNYNWAYIRRGYVYRDLKEYGKAIDDYNKAIELDSNDNWGYISRGDVYRDLKEYEKAIDDYNKAIELKPNYNWGYISRGHVYRDLKEYEKAIDDYNKAIELNPNANWVYIRRGEVYRDLKEYDKAIDDYNKAIELDPSYYLAYIRRGDIYSFLSKHDEATRNYTIAFDLDNNNNDKELSSFIFKYIEVLTKNVYDKNFNLEYIINKFAKDDDIKKLSIYEYVLLYFLTLKKDDEVEEIACYTSVRVFEKLLMKEKNEGKEKISQIRMSTLSKVNDPEEGSVLVKMLGKYAKVNIKEVAEEESYAVQTSFTRCVDSLTMFRLYGKNNNLEGTGVALVFSKDFFDTTFQHNDLPTAKIEIPFFDVDAIINTDLPKKNKQPLYYVMYYDDETNELVFNPYKSNYKNVIINLSELNKYTKFEYTTDYSKRDNDYYSRLENNIGYILKEVFNIMKKLNTEENIEKGYKALKNIKYLIKNSTFVEEQELRILKILKSDELEIDHQINSVYKNYSEALTYDNALKKIILGSKIENAHSLAEASRVYIKKQSEKDTRYEGIKVLVSKASFN